MLVQGSASLAAKKVTEEKISLFNILTCLLCCKKAQVAHICPNCSKFYCEKCIKGWIQGGNTRCPNCQCHISDSNIVNCSKLSHDLTSALEALIQLEAPQDIICKGHSIAQTYYCEDCRLTICSDCIVLESAHRSHRIRKLKQIKMEFNEQILLYLTKIRKTAKDIEKAREEKSLTRNNQNELLKAKADKLKLHSQMIRTRYEQAIAEVSERLERILSTNKMAHQQGIKLYEQVLGEIKDMSKSTLVRNSRQEYDREIEANMSQILQKFAKEGCANEGPCKNALNYLVCPKFAQKTFILYNYTQFREKKEVVYSDAFFDGPLEWRLKIYPGGLQKKQPRNGSVRFISTACEQYISIYIELVAGVREPARYRFNIEIVSQADQSKVISQIYEADFEAGKCWGYDEFANIATLYQKGYILPEEDSLKISVSVGPPSYFHSHLDQQAIIAQKLRTSSHNQMRIAQLKKLAMQKLGKATLPTLPQSSENPEICRIRSCEVLGQQPTQQQVSVQTPKSKQKYHSQQTWTSPAERDPPTKQPILANYEDFVVGEPRPTDPKCNEEFDHQAAELRKIYRKLLHAQERPNLLLF